MPAKKVSTKRKPKGAQGGLAATKRVVPKKAVSKGKMTLLSRWGEAAKKMASKGRLLLQKYQPKKASRV